MTEMITSDDWWSNIATVLQMQFEDNDFDGLQVENIIGGRYSDLLFDLDQCVALERELTELMPRIMDDRQLDDTDTTHVLQLLDLVQQVIRFGGVLELKRNYPIRGVLEVSR
jgi:hypothetical protein